jgi:PAS domain S-box-containing protein
VVQGGTLRFVNPAMMQLTESSEKEIIGMPLKTFVHSDDWASLSDNNKRPKGGTAHTHYVFRLMTRKGDIRWVEMNQITIDWEGRPATLDFIIDITEKKHAEEELKRSNTDLQQFAYIASHDLQEPLRMVISYLTLLEKRHKDQLDPEAEEFVQTAIEGGKRMKLLIDDLLQYSRVDTVGKVFESVEMNDLVERTLLMLKGPIEESKAIITVDPLPTVFADGSQITRVMQNLIVNAIKFHSPARPEVHISASTGPGEWIFSVKDNGIGMDVKYADKIFQMFQRLHIKDEYPGSGVGLAIAKKIVERHGGRIWVESEEGKGATFFFTILKSGGGRDKA